MKLTGAEIIVRSLQEEGVDTVFGYPGGAVLHTYDALFQQDSVRHVLVRHEQGAIHAAEGYAQATGKVGVGLVTSGPGATNAVTGLATANMDSVPMVVITGQVPTAMIGNDAFQEADTVGITRPCTKHNFLVKRVEDLAPTIRKAFHIASTGRPGPVVVDVPKDVSADECEFEYPQEVRMRSYSPTIKGHSGQIRKAVERMRTAERPMVYTGGGVVLGDAAEQLTQMVRTLNFPITNTLMGLGGFPGDDPQFLGMLGMHGTYQANMAVTHCDLLIAIGARFDDRVTGDVQRFAPHADIIHVDIDPASISKNVEVDIPIVGHVQSVLTEMNEALAKSGPGDPDRLQDWWEQIQEWRGRACLAYDRDSALIKPQFVLEKLYEVSEGNAIVTSDVGQHQMWAAQFYNFKRPRQWLNSGGLGTMGYGLPAALGAQMAYPDALVACVTGEGSIQMNIQELSTAKQYRLPVKVVNLNNGYLGMVRQWQELFYESRYAESYVDALPDFLSLAEAYGHVGLRTDKPGDVEGLLKEALSTDRAVFMDLLVDPSENVYPMVPAGAGLDEMVLV